MKHYLLLLLFLVASITAWGQKVTVTGTVIDKETGEPVTAATIVLLKADSTIASGVTSGLDGDFKLPSVRPGTYTLRISYVGYKTQTETLTLTKKERERDLGIVILATDAILMKAASVTANAAKVEMKEDTFVYNASAYRLPEGSALEELIKKLPGFEVGEDGKITANGKEVKKIMVDGKEYFLNDTKLAMKNLPTKVVEKIKAYDRQSDYSRVTGIDDGEEETVIDLTIKKGMKDGWLITLDGGIGSEDRYNTRFNVNRFTDNLQFSVIGSSNNVNDMGFGGGGPRGPRGMGGGITTSHMAGANIVWDNGRRQGAAGYLTLGGSVNYQGTKSYSNTKTNSETFLTGGTKGSSFSNSRNTSTSYSNRVYSQLRFEWQPDSLTNIMFRPSHTWSESRGTTSNRSITFNDNPYGQYLDPLTEGFARINQDTTIVNTSDRTGNSHSLSHNANGNLQINRRLGKAGRNVTLDVNGGYSHSESESWNASDMYYSKRDTVTRKYSTTPTTSYNVRARMSYSEPIFRGANLQFSYSAQYRFNKSNREMYEVARDSIFAVNGAAFMRDYLLGIIPSNELEMSYKDWKNSQYATYKEWNHEANLMLRYKVGDLQFNGGVSFQPQHTDMDYKKDLIDTTVTRNVFNWAPRLDVRWKISNTSQLRVRYNGYSSQPSMTNLLEVCDNSDPLNVSMGNSGLEPSWTHRGNLFYNNYIAEKQMGWMTFANFSTTKNSISNAMIYNTATGARYSRPENINGNWNANVRAGFNTALGAKKAWNTSTSVNMGYSRNVGYMSSNANLQGVTDIRDIFSLARKQNLLQKSTTNSTTVGGMLRLDWRGDLGNSGWDMEAGLNGSVNFNHSRNNMQTNTDLDTWDYGYGGNLLINTPWGMQFATDVTQENRDGYNDKSMNTRELVWNAQLSQSLLKDKSLTIMLQAYDLLQERSNISRAISATMRSDTHTEAINSYVMLRVIYRLNLLGNREMRDGMRGFGGPGFGGFGGPGGPGGGGRPGGGGGGRPMMRM